MRQFLANKTPRFKIAILCYLVVTIAITLYVVITNVSHLGKIPVEIKYAPLAASVYIDNQNYSSNNAVNYLEPGMHHIMVVMSGFEIYEDDVEITNETRFLSGGLTPLGDEGALSEKYKNDYEKAQMFLESQATKEAKEMVKEWPILGYLPITKKNYSIGTKFDEDNNLIVTVRAKPEQLNEAINKLLSLPEISISEQNIEIVDFVNELEGSFSNNNSSDPTTFIRTGYSKLQIPHQVNQGRESGDYYYTTISVGKYAETISVTYRIILQKSNDTWRIIGTPYPILTSFNTPNVDQDIIDAANQLSDTH